MPHVIAWISSKYFTLIFSCYLKNVKQGHACACFRFEDMTVLLMYNAFKSLLRFVL